MDGGGRGGERVSAYGGIGVDSCQAAFGRRNCKSGRYGAAAIRRQTPRHGRATDTCDSRMPKYPMTYPSAARQFQICARIPFPPPRTLNYCIVWQSFSNRTICCTSRGIVEAAPVLPVSVRSSRETPRDRQGWAIFRRVRQA